MRKPSQTTLYYEHVGYDKALRTQGSSIAVVHAGEDLSVRSLTGGIGYVLGGDKARFEGLRDMLNELLEDWV